MSNLSKLWPLGLGAWVCLPALADVDLPALPAAEIHETLLVTATRRDSGALDQVASIASVEQAELALVGHTHINEALVRIPGANIARGNGQEYLAAIRSPVLTGAGACGAFLTAQDGIPLRAAGFCNVNELFEANTEQARRIEVIRGPGTALYGSNALHGIVNVISPPVDGTGATGLGLELGPDGYTRVKLSAGGRLGRGGEGAGEQALRVDANFTDTDGYRDDAGYGQQKLLLGHSYREGDLTLVTRFSATNLNQETAGFVVGTNAYKDKALRDTNPNPEAFRDARSLRLSSQIDYRLSDTAALRFTPYARYTDMTFLQHFLPGQPVEENGQRSLGLQSAFFAGAGDRTQWIAGVDLEYTSGYLHEFQDSPTEGSPFLRETIPVGDHYDYDVDATLLAPFIHWQGAIGEAWSVSAGLRYEAMRYDYDNRMLAGRTRADGSECGFGGCRFSRPEDREDTFENWSPKLGLRYRFAENHRAYVNLSHGFRAPQATELYRLQRAQRSARLDSESIAGAEVGLRGVEPGRYSYDISLYGMKKSDVIFRDSDFFNVSGGKTRHRGVEVQVKYQLSPAWRVGASGSYAHHSYAENQILGGVNIKGNDIDSAPRRFGSVQLGWRPHESAQVELEWLHMGRYYTDVENLHRYPGHNLFNLRASWRPRQAAVFYARLTNLSDRKYAERADFTGFTGERYFPGEPRALYFGVELTW